VPGFPPGHSTVVYSYLLWFTLTYTPIPTSIPSLLPPRIDRASISHDSPAKSWSIRMSITDQITDPPAWLVHMSFLCTASLPFSFPRKCHYSEKFSRSTAFARALPSRGVSPVLSWVRETIPCPSLCRIPFVAVALQSPQPWQRA
jgi:hypothetical protein